MAPLNGRPTTKSLILNSNTNYTRLLIGKALLLVCNGITIYVLYVALAMHLKLYDITTTCKPLSAEGIGQTGYSGNCFHVYS